VVIKLSNLTTRNLIFRHKKTALPHDRDLASNKVRPRYSIYEDLTPANHAHLRSLSADPRVKSIWSYNGQIRFKHHESEDIVKVRALSDTFDSLVKPTNAMSH
jgi:hypothetical protein